MPADIVRWMQSLFLPAVRSFREPSWSPSADVYRTPDGWLVKLDLAGVRPEDIEVAVSGRRLRVRGSRHDWCVGECSHSYLMEIAYSTFERSIELPEDIDRRRLETEYRDGMLLIRLREAR